MNRLTERLIDLVALGMLLVFAYVMRATAPELSGGIAVAACAFWLTKNASAPHPSQEQAAATAAAAVLSVARSHAEIPSPVEVINTEQTPVPIMPVKK